MRKSPSFWVCQLSLGKDTSTATIELLQQFCGIFFNISWPNRQLNLSGRLYQLLEIR